MIALTTLIYIAVPCVLGIVWMVRLEGRINVSDAHSADIVARLKRIESKLDYQNGFGA